MRVIVQREVLLKPLQQVVNVVERRQTMPVLANLLVVARDGGLSLTGSDSEVEMIGRCQVEIIEPGETTIPARKLFDLVRALPDGSSIQISLKDDKITIQAGRSRFVLSTLPSRDYPAVEAGDLLERVEVPEAVLRELIDRTKFAMAQQDVRYYLNGLLIDLDGSTLRCVATDGHRLAMCEADLPAPVVSRRHLIVPSKGIQELQRLLESGDRHVLLEVGRNHVRIQREDVTFTSKLIDGRFPDYEAVMPIGADKIVIINREALRSALQRASILANEKYRGVKLELHASLLRVAAHNPEQEEAEEELEAESTTEHLSVGFNVVFLLDALTVLREEKVKLMLRDANSGALLTDVGSDRCWNVVMPLRL